MLCSPKITATALFTAVVLFAASTDSQCSHYNSSNTAGYPEEVASAYPVYFSCPDDLFLVTVEASYESVTPAIQVLTWTCAAAEEIGFAAITSSSSEASLSFTVGITEVTTRVVDSNYPYLTNMHVGGYDLDSTGADIVFESKGPFGDFDDEASVLPATPFSLCSSGSFATGMTVWTSAEYVYGVILECAYVTTTCAPLDYPPDLLEDGSDFTGTLTTPVSSTVPTTDPPNTSASSTVATDPPSSSGGTAYSYGSDFDDSVTTSASSTVPTTDPPNTSASSMVATDPPRSSGGTADSYGSYFDDNVSTSASSTVPTTDSPNTSASSMVATDPPSSSGGTVPAISTPSPLVGTSSGADTPSPSVNIEATNESSSSSATAIIAGASVAGGLCVLAICVGLACGFHRREARNTRHPDKPQDTFGMPATMGGGERGGGFAPKEGTVTHVVYVNAGIDPLQAQPSSTSDPPPPYSERSFFHDAPQLSYP